MSGKAALELDRVRIEKADALRQIAELRAEVRQQEIALRGAVLENARCRVEREAAEADKARLSEEIRTVLKSVLHHFGPEGAHKITSDCLSARAALSGSGAGGWREPNSGHVYSAADLARLMEWRDKFIVSKGLWGEFTATLDRLPSAPTGEAS